MAVVRRARGQSLAAERPKLPPEAAYLWVAYCALDATRMPGMGVGPITYTEIAAYAHVYGFEWTAFEVDLLRAVDREFLIHHADKAKERRGKR